MSWFVSRVSYYEPETDLYEQFSEAEKKGKDGIYKIYDKDEWKKDFRNITEMMIVLAWKMWDNRQKGKNDLKDVYRLLQKYTALHAEYHLSGEEYEYYTKTWRDIANYRLWEQAQNCVADSEYLRHIRYLVNSVTDEYLNGKETEAEERENIVKFSDMMRSRFENDVTLSKAFEKGKQI